ncbi:proton-conducting transporter membrane subunit [Nesterenkonia muleiensis]|uniref:proton-conducting transporter transmembrane domain-containing protein n=1 Tax=Nesterenkonia muleiensis TaxID=2282648 RepID=UPI00192E4643|nr:proton-conducting transporter membrane subunit [Nesterenkonia muleiensis]
MMETSSAAPALVAPVLMTLSLCVPLAAVAVIALAGVLGPQRAHRLRRGTAIASPLTVLPAGLLALTGEGTELEVPWLLFGSVFAMDATARALTLIAVLLYGAALMAVTWVKLRDAERGSGALSAFLMVCFTGNIGVYLAADAVSFYLAFAVLSFSAAGLVIHYRHQAARRATRIYLVMSVISETAILAGLLLAAAALPSLNRLGGESELSPHSAQSFAAAPFLIADAPEAIAASPHTGLIVTLLLVGFGVKAGTVPLHVWLPLAHPAAPPAASAVLSGAMVKAGLVGWLRFLPTGDGAALTTAGNTLLTLALVGAFAAVVIGVLQSDPKVVLAYSTISQMGFITCLVAAGMLVPELAGVTASAAVVYAVHHGLAKGALFLGVPVVKHYGRGPTGVVVLIGMAGAGLAVAGAPLTSGAYGKYVSKEAVEGISVLGLGLDQILPLVATGSTLLLIRFAFVVRQTELQPRRRPDGATRLSRVKTRARSESSETIEGWPALDGLLLSWLAVCVAGIVVPWLIGQHWIAGAEEFSWTAGALWDATWPVLLGFLLGIVIWRLAARRKLPSWLRADGELVKPGDLIGAEESLAVRTYRTGGSAASRVHEATESAGSRAADAASALAGTIRDTAASGERRLAAWEGSGAVIVVVLAAAATVLIWRWWG